MQFPWPSSSFSRPTSSLIQVATLSLFNALRVDPTLNNLVVGESVLNDAVALIAFRSIAHYGINLGSEVGSVVASFLAIAAGSVSIGVVVGGACALFLRCLAMSKSADLPQIETCLFFSFAYGAFVCAEMPHFSGIVAAMFAGIVMRRYATPHLSAGARKQVDAFLKLLCTLCDTFIYLLVGLALVLEVPWAERETGETFGECLAFFAIVMTICLLARGAHVFALLGLCNCVTQTQVPHSLRGGD